MRNVHIWEFFNSEDNRKLVLRICKYHFPKGDEAKDVAQDVTEKLLNYNGDIHFPEDQTGRIKFITRVVMNYMLDKIEKEKRKAKATEEMFHWNRDEVEMPDMTLRWHRLNELILLHRDLFTEPQLKLWDCMFKKMKMKEMVKVLNKTPHNISTHWEKMREKIRKVIKYKDLL